MHTLLQLQAYYMHTLLQLFWQNQKVQRNNYIQ